MKMQFAYRVILILFISLSVALICMVSLLFSQLMRNVNLTHIKRDQQGFLKLQNSTQIYPSVKRKYKSPLKGMENRKEQNVVRYNINAAGHNGKTSKTYTIPVKLGITSTPVGTLLNVTKYPSTGGSIKTKLAKNDTIKINQNPISPAKTNSDSRRERNNGSVNMMDKKIHKSPHIANKTTGLNKTGKKKGECKFCVDHTQVNYTLEPTLGCEATEKINLLVLIESSYKKDADIRRNKIRGTWANTSLYHPFNVKYYFLLGRCKPPNCNPLQLQEEARKFGDILSISVLNPNKLLNHFTTSKVLSSFQWAVDHCSNFSYVLKVGDKIFVNIKSLLAFIELNKSKTKRVVLGNCPKMSPVIRDKKSRHYVSPNNYAPSYWPPFCFSTAYMMSYQAVEVILQKAKDTPVTPLEDATIGLLAKGAGNIKIVNIKSWTLVRPKHAKKCPLFYTIQGVDKDQVKKVWEMCEKVTFNLDLVPM